MPITLSSTTLTFNDSTTQTTSSKDRAFVNFNGTGVVAIRASFGMSSITDNGTGDYTFNLSTALSDANYSFIMQTGGTSSAYAWRTVEDLPAARTTTTVRVYTIVMTAATNVDVAQISGVFLR